MIWSYLSLGWLFLTTVVSIDGCVFSSICHLYLVVEKASFWSLQWSLLLGRLVRTRSTHARDLVVLWYFILAAWETALYVWPSLLLLYCCLYLEASTDPPHCNIRPHKPSPTLRVVIIATRALTLLKRSTRRCSQNQPQPTHTVSDPHTLFPATFTLHLPHLHLVS